MNVPASLRASKVSGTSRGWEIGNAIPHVLILSVRVTVTGDVSPVSRPRNSVDVCEQGVGYAQQKLKISKQKAKKKRRKPGAVGIILVEKREERNESQRRVGGLLQLFEGPWGDQGRGQQGRARKDCKGHLGTRRSGCGREVEANLMLVIGHPLPA